MRLWGGRFAEENDRRVADFTRSIELDRELAADDMRGSIAHVRGARSRGHPDRGRGRGARRGTGGAGLGCRERAITWDPDLEDVHLNLESALADRIGPVAGQAPDGSVAERPGRDGPTALVAPRHRPAGRGAGRFRAARSSRSPSARGRRSCPARPTSSPPSRCCSPITCSRTSRWPNGTERAWPTRGGARTSRRSGPGRSPAPGIPLDREATAVELGFDGVTANSLDAVSDRDFVIELAGSDRARDGAPQPAGGRDHVVVEPAVRVHPRKLTPSRPASRSCRTRRTPTPPSSCAVGRRASSAPWQGCSRSLKGLPLAYQRDLQEDKPPLFDAVAVYGGVARRHGRTHRDAFGRSGADARGG